MSDRLRVEPSTVVSGGHGLPPAVRHNRGNIHPPEPVPFRAKTEYGLLALLELARLQSTGEVLQVGEIAQRQDIPDRYLEQMLTDLRKAGILRSIRGPRGGLSAGETGHRAHHRRSGGLPRGGDGGTGRSPWKHARSEGGGLPAPKARAGAPGRA